MRDQAERLREIIDNLKKNQKMRSSLKEAEMSMAKTAAEDKSARIITITSGKGGVGKSNIAVNMSIALSNMGFKVALIDGDLGLANVDVLLGISPEYSMADILHCNKSIMEALCEGPGGIKFISGGYGNEELVKLNKEQLEKFIGNIGILDSYFDIIVVDTGAGISDNVLSFVMASDEVIIVTTPDPTAIMDAYALIKVISSRSKDKDIKVIVNRAENVGEANNVLEKLVMVSDKFLKMKVSPLGFVLYDESVIKAVKSQIPFLTSNPNSVASKNIRKIADKLINSGAYAEGEIKNSGIRDFINRVYSFLKN